MKQIRLDLKVLYEYNPSSNRYIRPSAFTFDEWLRPSTAYEPFTISYSGDSDYLNISSPAYDSWTVRNDAIRSIRFN